MNKRAAKKATDEFEGTFGTLREMLDCTAASGISAVNPVLSKEQVLDILSKSIENRKDNEQVKIWKPDPYSTRSRMMRTRDSLIVQNILRECM